MAPKNSVSDELQSLIQSTTPANLKETLLTALAESSEADLKVLSGMLTTLAESATVEKHCVRCHEVFFDHTNGPDACVIAHNIVGYAEPTNIGSDGMTITLECCDFEFPEDDGAPEDPCYVVYHTTNTDEVEYFENGEMAEEKDEGTNENVVRCKERGCMGRKGKRKGASIMKLARSAKKRKVLLKRG